MKQLEQALKDYEIISEKYSNLRETSGTNPIKKYLTKDVIECVMNYKRDYGILYSPEYPPTQRQLDNDDMGSVYF